MYKNQNLNPTRLNIKRKEKVYIITSKVRERHQDAKVCLTDSDRQTDRQTDGERDREQDREIQRQRQRHKQRETQTETERQTERTDTKRAVRVNQESFSLLQNIARASNLRIHISSLHQAVTTKGRTHTP